MSDFSEPWLSWMQAGCWQLALLVCIVGVACLAARTAPAALRHALWLLVLAKVFLPPTLWTPVSMGRWGSVRCSVPRLCRPSLRRPRGL